MPKFQIVTTESLAYTEGSYAVGVFSDIKTDGESAGVLESYRYEDGYVVLSYGSGFELALPVHRVRYVADRTA